NPSGCAKMHSSATPSKTIRSNAAMMRSRRNFVMVRSTESILSHLRRCGSGLIFFRQRNNLRISARQFAEGHQHRCVLISGLSLLGLIEHVVRPGDQCPSIGHAMAKLPPQNLKLLFKHFDGFGGMARFYIAEDFDKGKAGGFDAAAASPKFGDCSVGI